MKNKVMKKILMVMLSATMLIGSASVTAFAQANENAEQTEATEQVIEEQPAELPATEGTPFSTPGNGQLVDDKENDSTKQFLTVQTKNGNTFYMVIDRSGTSENVYMMSLVEIGTTNKTHYEDYEEAITEETKALLKVHTSNYRIVGFTESVGIDELVPIAKEHGIPVVEDLGSGVLINLEKYGLTHEPTVQESIAHGADVVCFSGDKLLGGPQAGIIIGKKKYIDMMKKNQLTRALRIDKFTAAALEMVLMEYLSEETAVQNIPVLRMIAMPLDEIEKEAGYFARILRRTGMDAKIQIVSCESQIGGGSLPLERMESRAVSIQPNGMSVAEMEEKMRHLEVPIIPRTVNDSICLDVRTIERKDYKMIASELTELLGQKEKEER